MIMSSLDTFYCIVSTFLSPDKPGALQLILQLLGGAFIIVNVED